MNLEDLLQEYLHGTKLMQLATLGEDGQPWLCNVYFVHDEDNSIYWTSARSRRHSLEIKKDSRVAVSIVYDHERKQALQITGAASEVSLDDSERVDGLYSKKYGDKDRLTEIMKDLPEGRSYWKVEPTTISFWDEFNFPNEPKQEHK